MSRTIADLRWRFSEGVSIFEGRSAMGGQLQRAKELYVELPSTPRKYRRKRQAPWTCIQCEAPLRDETCDVCGYSEAQGQKRITAQGKGETMSFKWEPADDDDYTRYRETVDQFEAVLMRSPFLAAVLQAAYGVEGSRYTVAGVSAEALRRRADYHPHYEIYAVLPLTPSGQKLDALAIKKGAGAMAQHQRIYEFIAKHGSRDKNQQVVWDGSRDENEQLIWEAIQEGRRVRDQAVMLWEKVGREIDAR